MKTSRSLLIAVAGGVAAVCAASPGFAHHSTAMFDMDKTVDLKGTVKSFEWTQPHTFIYLVVEGAGGGEYGVEGMSPSYLGRNGWSKRTLNPGDKVTLTIHPLKDGRKGGFDASVTWPNGTIMYNLPRRDASGALTTKP